MSQFTGNSFPNNALHSIHKNNLNSVILSQLLKSSLKLSHFKLKALIKSILELSLFGIELIKKPRPISSSIIHTSTRFLTSFELQLSISQVSKIISTFHFHIFFINVFG